MKKVWTWALSHRAFCLCSIAALLLFVTLSSIEGQYHFALGELSFSLDRTSGAALGGVLLALCGLMFAVHQIDMAREVVVLVGMADIVREAAKRISAARRSVRFMAASPAIGLSGARDEFNRSLQPAVRRAARRLRRNMEILSYKIDAIKEFYKAQNIPSDEVDGVIMPVIGAFMEEIRQLVSLKDVVEYSEIPVLHLLITDAEGFDKKRRRAVLWYLEVEQTELSGVGFSTDNEIVIKTLQKVFKLESSKYPNNGTADR